MNVAESYQPCSECGCAIRHHTLRKGCDRCRCTAHLDFAAELKALTEQATPTQLPLPLDAA